MHAESREVADTAVAVTGASSGIGAATARPLLGAGAKVAVQAWRREPLDALADAFAAQVGCPPRWIARSDPTESGSP